MISLRSNISSHNPEMNILVIDNIDSFVYNLVQYIGELGAKPIVFQNNADYCEIERVIKEKGICGIIISPGPKTPVDAGISNEIIKKFGKDIPLLGVCLGHQCIGYSFGAEVRRAKVLKHGKTSMIKHNEKEIFSGIPSPFEATRYHSLVIDNLPGCLEITARSVDDNEIMGVKHRDYPVYGVQFHPESILTGFPEPGENGMKIVKNFLDICKSNETR